MITTYLAGSSELAAAIATPGEKTVVYVGSRVEVRTGPDLIRYPVPQEVTMRQARLALHAAGKLNAVNAAIAALPDPPKTAALIEWEYSSTMRRDSQFVALLGPALGLDAAGLDALFIAAAKLEEA